MTDEKQVEKVEQRHRYAAARYAEYHIGGAYERGLSAAMLKGMRDDDPLVQAFAEFEAALTQPSGIKVEAREALRDIINQRVCGFVGEYSHDREEMISAILALFPATPVAGEEEHWAGELNLCKRVIALANNSLFGSLGYFLSLNGGEPDERHLANEIEKLKARARELWQKLNPEMVAQQLSGDFTAALSPDDGWREREEWQSREGCTGAMTADRVVYFLERFKREEKMLGPHEQWALDYAMAAIRALPRSEG